MALIELDHVNIRTTRLAEMVRFYETVLELAPGARPPFRSEGAWLYCGDKAAVHLVEVPETPDAPKPRIEHFAFRAAGLADFLERIKSQNVAYRVSIVPELSIVQVNIFDPDGNHIEIAFRPEERVDELGYYVGV